MRGTSQEKICGEIWLLATTLKNAKMLTMVIAPRWPLSYQCFVFCDGSAFCGAFVFALPVRENQGFSG
jgi:hypothetical protein